VDEDASRAVTIVYCTQCNWLLRAAWMGQELLSTFQTELTALTLVPGTGGVFRVTAGDVVVWDRAVDGGFPEITELKRRVRDQVAPDRPLGHADRAAARAADQAQGRAAGAEVAPPGT
jgi:selenoprotein W-related protein